MRNFTLLLLTLMAVGCGGHKSKKIESATPQTVHFKRVMPPVQSTPEAQFQYMVDHYWDRFDFTDTLFIERVDSAEMMRAYVEYIATYVGPYNGEPVARLMKRASVSRKMLDYFATMSEKLFHDPNSPLRSDELYIPVLEAQIARYPDIGSTVEELAEFSSNGANVDFAGRIALNDKGEEVFTFGKYKGCSVEEVFRKEPSYYSWMMDGNFPQYTKKVITEIRLRIK